MVPDMSDPEEQSDRPLAGPVSPAAWIVAIAADVVQFAALPLFVEGALSPLNDALDVAVAVALVWMLGWHIALLPTLIAELIPVVGIAPTWTTAVAIIALARRKRAVTSSPAAAAPSDGSRAEVIEARPRVPPHPTE